MPTASTMTDAPSPEPTARPPRVGTWVALTVAGWHLAFFATGAVALALASSPAGTVFEGLAEPFHQKLMLASQWRVLAGYAVVALGALVLTYPLVRLWTGSGPASCWGLVARTMVVLGVLMTHGWLRLAHTQPYFLGPETYDTWYFRALAAWPEEVRERVLFVLFSFLPGVVMVAAAGVYVVAAARWFREGGRASRMALGAAGSAAVLAAGWLVAPHFIGTAGLKADGPMNVVMLSSDEVASAPVSPAAAALQPHLASLAAESVVLTNMRSPLPTALGAAASLHTGQAPHTHGLQTPHPSAERVSRTLASAPLLPALLSAHGYATAVLGDSGAGAFATAGGLGFAEVEAGGLDDYPLHLAGAVYPAHFIIPTWLDNRLGRRLLPGLSVLPGRVSRDVVTDRLTERLEEGAETGTPFFLHVVYSHPEPVSGPGSSTAAEPPAATPPSAGSFDDQLGRVLESLEKNGLKNKTILVVLGRAESGSGAAAAGGPPPGARVPVPVVFHVPGEAYPPGVVSQLSRLYDLAPTLLEVLGLPPEPAMEGVSLRPCLENPAVRLPLVAFGESAGFPERLPGAKSPEPEKKAFRDGVRLDPASAYRLVLKDETAALRRKSRWMRTERWQLVFTPGEAADNGLDEWRLFDLQVDPGLTRDVKLQNPKVWQAMEASLRRWVDEKKETNIQEIFPDGEPPAVVLPGT